MNTHASFSVSSGVASLISKAGSVPKKAPVFTIDGDLSQMAKQAEFLRGRGIEVGYADVYPVLFSEEDTARALKLIWESKVDGWWHYKAAYAKRGICDSTAFDAALGVQCARSHAERERERSRGSRW